MVTIDLNDEKTKLKLLSILYSNYNGDIPNNEVEEEVNKQLDNSNTDPIVLRAINSSELNNKRITIRLLSKSEFNKYIDLGTLDGSITTNDVNVWHYTVYQEYFVGTGNFYIAYDLFSDNTVNTTKVSGKGSKFGTYAYDNRNWATMGTEYSVRKDIDIYYDAARTSPSWESSYGRYSRGHISCSFRPVFQIKDNIKSKNIYY